MAYISHQRMPPAYTLAKLGIETESWSVHKFGYNGAVDTTLIPLCAGGIYRTPTTLTGLEVVSDDVNDAAEGTGARTVQITGIGADYHEVKETVSLNGTTPVALVNTYYRVWRVKVMTAGAYADATVPSQKGTITVQETGAGDAWAIVGEVTAGVGIGQSQIGVYTIPAGYVGFMTSSDITVDSGKTATALLFYRPDIDTVAAPFSARRLQNQFDGLNGSFSYKPCAPKGPYFGKTDIGFMGKVDATAASISVDFELLLIKEEAWPYE